MSLESDLVAVLQAQCPRVFPGTAPLNTARPFVTWEHIGGDPLRYMDGTAAVQRWAQLQVNTWCNTKAEAVALALAIESALCTAGAFTADPVGAFTGRHEDQVEPPLYGTQQEFAVLGTR